MKHARRIAIGIFLIAAQFIIAQDANQRGICFDFGIGWSPITNYPIETQSVFDTIKNVPGVDELKINMNIDLGFPIFRTTNDDNISQYYLSLGADGFATSYSDSYGSIMLAEYVYGIGIKSTTGNFMSMVNIGPSIAAFIAESNGISYTSYSDTGFGVSSKFGYMTNANSGFGIFIGGIFILTSISSSISNSAGLTAEIYFL